MTDEKITYKHFRAAVKQERKAFKEYHEKKGICSKCGLITKEIDECDKCKKTFCMFNCCNLVDKRVLCIDCDEVEK